MQDTDSQQYRASALEEERRYRGHPKSTRFVVADAESREARRRRQAMDRSRARLDKASAVGA